MALSTFSDLKSAMQDWSERSDLSGKMNDFVTLAEARIRKDLIRAEIRVREAVTSDTLTPSSGVCTLPTRFMAMKTVQCQASDPTILTYKPMTWLREAYPDGTSGTPAYYGIVGSSLYMFPLTSSDIAIDFWEYPEPLSDSNTSNWLLTNYPDVYLWAGLTEIAFFGQDEELEGKYIKLLTAAVDGLRGASFGADASSPTIGASGYPA